MVLALLGPCLATTDAKGIKNSQAIIEQVKKLDLSYKGYTLGEQLDSSKLEKLKKSPVKESYPGTIKLHDGDLILVVDKKHKIIVAISKQIKKASSKQLKSLVSEMMLIFGEPTALAHEKIIYWAYGKNGKITEEAYDKAKDVGKLEVIATVKLNSSKEIFKVTSGKEPEADVYVIISSEPLIKALITL